ncbi:DsbC family protein (plasmid) [Xenorhabdus stockiae]|uniref:DsbC family protein n=1 Tax=Xenorhabdus stockiae TaxID=351614 RepID=UPI003CE93F6C
MCHKYTATLQDKILSVFINHSSSSNPVIVMELEENYRFYIKNNAIHHDAYRQYSIEIYSAQSRDEAEMVLNAINTAISDNNKKNVTHHDSNRQYSAQPNDEAEMDSSAFNIAIRDDNKKQNEKRNKTRKKIVAYGMCAGALGLAIMATWGMGVTHGRYLAYQETFFPEKSFNTLIEHVPSTESPVVSQRVEQQLDTDIQNNTNKFQRVEQQLSTDIQSNTNESQRVEQQLDTDIRNNNQPQPVITKEDYQHTAQRLQAAAQSGKYTIPLSAGHARTLYVFSDPLCPNCKTIEPILEALTRDYNVEVFPVTLVGKQQTVDLITPILCKPSKERKPLWKELYQADMGMTPENNQTPTFSCDIGKQALAKNDAAFDFYNLPGTPSLLSDDGRYIPLESLRSDDALAAFLNSPIQ